MNIRHLYILFFLSTCVWAQDRSIHNEGEVHIQPNTLVSVHSPFNNGIAASLINDGEFLIKSDIINDGIWSFTEGLVGYTRLESQVLQNLQGSRPTHFYDILFNNPTRFEAFRIGGELEIHGEAIFHDGIANLRTTDGSLTFFEDAYAIDANDDSYVDGWVDKLGNASFEYPIGHNGYYRPLQTFGSSSVADAYSAIYHLENSNNYFPHESKAENIGEINTEEYWELNDISTSDHVYVSLSLHPETTPDIFRDPANEPTIVAWNTSTQRWEDIEGILDSDATSITSMFKVDLYSAYTLATTTEVDEVEEDLFFIYNAVNPKDTGGNDHFRITGLDKYPDNDVTIFNRWGVEVYHTKRYDTNNNVFRGYSEGRATIRKNRELPEGTYFYVLRRTDPATGKRLTDTGYLYLIR